MSQSREPFVTLCLLPGNFMLASILSEVLPKLLWSQVSLTMNLPCQQPLTAESSELIGEGVGSHTGHQLLHPLSTSKTDTTTSPSNTTLFSKLQS